MPQTNKTANMLNFDNTNHKTKYISQFTNKDCRKKETLLNYEQTMYVTTLNVLYNLKHGLGIFDKKMVIFYRIFIIMMIIQFILEMKVILLHSMLNLLV